MSIKQSISEEMNKITKNCYNRYKLLLNPVCKELNLECFDYEFDNPKISGMLVKDKQTGKWEIYVNDKHSVTRQRFTIAHEIGHYLSWKHNSYSYDELETKGEIEDYAISFRHENISSQAETEANEIAAELLMSEDKVKELVEKGLTMEEMAEEFFVSESAMTIRLKILYEDLMVI